MEFYLTPGEAHDLDGVDVLLAELEADALIADKVYDADKRVRQPFYAKYVNVVIPPKD